MGNQNLDFDDYFTENNVPMTGRTHYDVTEFPPDVREPIRSTCRIWKWRPPTKKSKDFSLWIKEMRDIIRIVGGEGEVEHVMKRVYARWHRLAHDPDKEAWHVGGIQSLPRMVRNEVTIMESEPNTKERYTGGKYADAIEH